MSIPQILIVGDQADASDMLQAVLPGEGYDLVVAATGPEALARAKDLTPDVVLLDAMMAGVDAFEVCRRLRADPLGQGLVIMVTAPNDRNSRLRGIQAGADGFLTREVNPVELMERVRSMARLNRYRQLLSERCQQPKLEDDKPKRDGELRLLKEVLSVSVSTPDAQEVLYRACEALANALELPYAAVLLTDRLGDVCSSVAVRRHDDRAGIGNLDTEDRRRPGVDFPTLLPLVANGCVSTCRTPVVMADARADPRVATLLDDFRALGFVSALIVPIVVQEVVIGSLEVMAQERRDFGEQDLAVAQIIADSVGQTLDRCRLDQALRHHAQRLEDSVARRTFELEAERDRTRAILEAVGEAVVVTDLEGAIQYLNPAAVALTGFPADEASGQSSDTWQSEVLPVEYKRHMDEVRQSGETWQGQAVHKRKDGTVCDVAVTVAPLREPVDGRLAGLVSVERDITPIKTAERTKDEFVSNVSHELRTPLSVITLISANLDKHYERLSDARRRRMIQDIREYAATLEDLIEDVLETSRIDSRRTSREREDLNLADLAEMEMARQRPLLQRKEQNLSFVGEKRLPVWGNEGQLRRVIRNVLNNAIKYTPPGGHIICESMILDARDCADAEWSHKPMAHPLKTPKARPGRRWAILRVVDNGYGIEEADLNRIFQRFYRAKSQEGTRGTGLGLSIAKDLVELHGGHLKVASAPGEGTAFSILLPLDKYAESGTAQGESRHHEHETGHRADCP